MSIANPMSEYRLVIIDGVPLTKTARRWDAYWERWNAKIIRIWKKNETDHPQKVMVWALRGLDKDKLYPGAESPLCRGRVRVLIIGVIGTNDNAAWRDAFKEAALFLGPTSPSVAGGLNLSLGAWDHDYEITNPEAYKRLRENLAFIADEAKKIRKYNRNVVVTMSAGNEDGYMTHDGGHGDADQDIAIPWCEYPRHYASGNGTGHRDHAMLIVGAHSPGTSDDPRWYARFWSGDGEGLSLCSADGLPTMGPDGKVREDLGTSFAAPSIQTLHALDWFLYGKCGHAWAKELFGKAFHPVLGEEVTESPEIFWTDPEDRVWCWKHGAGSVFHLYQQACIGSQTHWLNPSWRLEAKIRRPNDATNWH